MLKRILPLVAMAAAVIGFVLPVMAASPLPREPMPEPTLPGTFQGVPKPSIRIGTRPKFDPSNIGALPDLKIVRVTPHIHSRVAGICRSGRKDRPGGSIPVLNFDVVVKNVGRGTANMDRYGVILSAQTMDFHERVFDTNKRYQGGTGGPRLWAHIRMAPIAPGATFVAHTGLGIGRNNTTFPIARMHELAGQTHRFRIKLTSYGSPGLKESNTRNNEYIVSYTFPRNFCLPAADIHVRPVGVPVSTLPTLPDLTIVRVTPRLHVQTINACRTGRSPHGALVGFDLKVKNIGTGVADLSRYSFAVHATSTDGRTPAMRGGDGYSGARMTPTRVAPGQTFNITGVSGIVGGYYGHPVTFPVSRYSELAGKTRQFKVELVTGRGIGQGLPESNYNNNSAIVSYTFPSDFCMAQLRGGVSQTAPTLKPHLVIQSIHTQLRRPYECRTDGPTFADGDLVLKNTGGDFIPGSGEDYFHVHGRLSVGSNLLLLSSVGHMPRIPAGATRRVRFVMTGTAGILHTPTPPMSVLAGRTVALSVVSFDFRLFGNWNSRVRFPADFCAARTTGGISVPIGSGQTVKPNITGFQFAGGKSCVSPRGIFTIKGSTFGRSAGGRTIQLGGYGMGVNLSIQSWNNRAIRVQLPRTARLQYRKNYWVRIQAPAVAGSIRTLSNLKRGVVLCPPTVRTGTSGSAGNPPAGRQNGGRTVTVAVGGLPDLEVSRLTISSPSPACFSLGINPGRPKYYTLSKLNVSLTLHNKGRVAYSTFDAAHNKQLPIGIIGDKYVGPKDRHGISLCLAPVAHMTFSNLNIPAGGSKTIQTQMQVMNCPFRGGRVVNQNGRLAEPLVRTLLGTTRPVKIGIGKAVFIRKNIPKESDYDNNFRRTMFRFPSSTCGGR